MNRLYKYYLLFLIGVFTDVDEVCSNGNVKVTTFVSTYSSLNDYCAVFQVNSLTSMGFHQAQFGVTPFVICMTQCKSEVFNEDCMAGMARYPDKYFELAIVDPPYGIVSQQARGIGSRIDATGKMNDWNNVKPTKEYFDELFRVSKFQIIWGANNFTLPETEYFIVWDKAQTVENFASAEYAWTNVKMPAKVFRYSIHQHNVDKGDKIHPTMKPIKLYRWLLHNYAKEGNKILDTHLGSGSSRIAAHSMKFDFTGFELDKDYYEAQEKRFKNFISQGTLF